MSTKPWFQNPRDGQPNVPGSAARPAGMTPTQAGPSSTPMTTGTPAAAPAATPSTAPGTASGPSANAEAGPSQLIVGPKIRLNGAEIEQCDTLVIEGHVKATIKSRILRITASGTFDGDADIETAEIEGTFNGTLNASTRLVVKAAGRVTGTIRYGRLVVEDGGELGGDIRPIGEASNARASSAATATARRDPLKDGIPTLTETATPALASQRA